MTGKLNGIPLIGQKLFTAPAQDVTIVDRGLYDLVHFTVSMMTQGQGVGPWGDPVYVRRPLGNGLIVTTTYLPPEAVKSDVANDAAATAKTGTVPSPLTPAALDAADHSENDE